MKAIFFFIFLYFSSFDVQIHAKHLPLDSGKDDLLKNDSGPVYQLPYKVGKKFIMIQGWKSSFSHKNLIAQDFKMKVGTPICAARSGVVVNAKEDGKKAGLKRKYLSEGNHIIIRHEDSTFAAYWHLKYNGVEVELGDSVNTGDLIGYSGHTGYSAFPHLHFQVFKYEKGRRKNIPAKFYTEYGVKYLKPLKRYKAIALKRKTDRLR